jgi:hypothetical protein
MPGAGFCRHDVFEWPQVHQCALQVIRFLSDQQRKLKKQAATGGGGLTRCPLSAVRSMSEGVGQQIQLTKLAKEMHTAQCSLRLKQAIQVGQSRQTAMSPIEMPFLGSGCLPA